ncbi:MULTISPECIES: hypothetical protein [Vibrio]|uniref:Uncharacterized protein n=1 Tax=Vibrio tasmaniensis TaxID=212663 RepID=A0A2N7NNC6_9VIBR|nr:hypothetical protein [Vibrio tasmaniensis]PMO89897.1 hypothetical protein BCT01_01035 [Vibrio tasmaniensis]PMP17764.1 hypothetical protein BCS92_04990 [Vibrio tasmaniensis]TKG28002.1 hypothetical protein FC057_22710 [Vibrio tasmaniensis]TKG41633.1 hypothetical protein FC063_07160 [Vibrio tasmaniensis]TKG44877.1 hypothetical protein FC061_20295 [Vibrio tasmaniensis]
MCKNNTHAFTLINEAIAKGESPVDIARSHNASILEAIGADSYYELPERVLQNRLKRGKMIISIDGIEKQCTSCLEYWPLTREFFHANNSNTDNCHGTCISCEIIRSTKERYKNQAKLGKAPSEEDLKKAKERKAVRQEDIRYVTNQVFH